MSAIASIMAQNQTISLNEKEWKRSNDPWDSCSYSLEVPLSEDLKLSITIRALEIIENLNIVIQKHLNQIITAEVNNVSTQIQVTRYQLEMKTKEAEFVSAIYPIGSFIDPSQSDSSSKKIVFYYDPK